jgi:hypothetical protein
MSCLFMTALCGEQYAPRAAAARSAPGVGVPTAVEGCTWYSRSARATGSLASTATHPSRPPGRGETALGKSTTAVGKPGGVTMVHRGGVPLSSHDTPCRSRRAESVPVRRTGAGMPAVLILRVFLLPACSPTRQDARQCVKTDQRDISL